MTKAIYQRSSIARPLEPQYRTNLAVLILAPIAAAIGYVWAGQQGAEGLSPIWTGLEFAVIAFVSWAAARELDPDRNAGAFIAMPLAIASLFFVEGAALWTLVLAMMLTRMVNRCVGQPVKFGDILLIIALAALAVFRDGFSEMGVVAAIAFSADALLDRRRTLSLLGAMITLSFTVWALFELQGDIVALLLGALQALDPTRLYPALALIGMGLIHAILIGRVRSVGDATGEPLSGLRVRTGILIFLLTALASLTEGEPDALAALPLFAVIAGAVLGRFIPFGRIA